VSPYQKGKIDLDFIGARDSEWQWHQLGHVQVCTLLQTDNHASTTPLSILQAGCPSCRPTNSVKALKAKLPTSYYVKKVQQPTGQHRHLMQCQAAVLISVSLVLSRQWAS